MYLATKEMECSEKEVCFLRPCCNVEVSSFLDSALIIDYQ